MRKCLGPEQRARPATEANNKCNPKGNEFLTPAWHSGSAKWQGKHQRDTVEVQCGNDLHELPRGPPQ